jgi:hypothetical protein
MANDSNVSAFESGRANLRETAKWMVSGIVGVAGLFVGASSVSQLGSMEIGCRFWLAVISLVIALGLCWIPFSRAISVLRSEVLSLGIFKTSGEGEFATAGKNIELLIKRDIPNELTLNQFIEQYESLRKTAFKNPNEDDAQRDVAALDDNYQRIRQACISELVGVRFDKLKDSIAFPGSVILLTFLIFSWAANPAKDAPKLLDKPYTEPLTATRLAKLKSLGAPPACLAPGTQLIAMATPEAGHEEALLIGRGCSPFKVMLSAGEIATADPIAK